MWALTKYCAERTHFTPNIPLKILLSLVTAAVAVATYSVVFAFAVLKLVGTGLHKVWLTINDPEFHAELHANVMAQRNEDEELANQAYWNEHNERLAAIDDADELHYTPAGRDIFGDWHDESWN